MTRFIFTITLLFSYSLLFAQTYAVGHNEKHYIDAARSNRDVWAEVYFPANAADTSLVAAGQFPTIVFGHGFVMAWSTYDYLWKYFVQRGYICVLPRTEGNISPSHTNFGGDLRFLSNLFGTVLNTQAGSKFQGHLTTKTAIAGHSMGGGSSFLACANNTQATTMVNFAAAQTNPRSSAAALLCSIPSLVIAGEKDCVAAPATNAKLMYDSLTATPYKQYVSITNGTHCNFASQGSFCEAGQIGTCGSLARAVQNNAVTSMLEPWFDYHLKGNCMAWQRFQDTITAFVSNQKITQTRIGAPALPTVSIQQNGSSLTASGTNIASFAWSNSTTAATISPTQSGVYTVTATAANGCTATASMNFTYINAEENNAFRQIQLYPNPSTGDGVINIQLRQAAEIHLTIHDATGKIVWQTNPTTLNDNYTLSLPTASLPAGVYIIKTETKLGNWVGKYVRL
ncbi:MAG: hypothetical protein RI894_2400 [Bacteroidota bacterium]|jgi:pimeloyl-ACP methyl ester carboxylesterase